MSRGDITSIEEAARAAALVFRHRGWQYGRRGEVPDEERLEQTIRHLVFSDFFKGAEPETSVSSGRFLVTRGEHLHSDDPNSRAVYLHLFDI